MKHKKLPQGTRLWHGTNSLGQFQIPDGPAWFCFSQETATQWCGWGSPPTGRQIGENRVLEFQTTEEISLMDTRSKKDWENLCLTQTGDPETGGGTLASTLPKKEIGWIGNDEVLLTNPQQSLKFVVEHTIPTPEFPQVKLKPAGKTFRKIKKPVSIGELLDWPWLGKTHPEIIEILVIPSKPEERWGRAATLAKWSNGTFYPKTRVLIHLTLKKFPNEVDLVRTLVHEITHLIQAKEGRWTKEHIIPTLPGYRENPLEKEARAFSTKIAETFQN